MFRLTPVAHVPGTSVINVMDPPPLDRDILAALMKKVDRNLPRDVPEGGWERERTDSHRSGGEDGRRPARRRSVGGTASRKSGGDGGKEVLSRV